VFDQVDEAPIAPQKEMSHQHAIDVDKSTRSDELSFSEHTNAREEEVDIEGALASVNNEYVAAKSSFGAIKRVRDGREARKGKPHQSSLVLLFFRQLHSSPQLLPFTMPSSIMQSLKEHHLMLILAPDSRRNRRMSLRPNLTVEVVENVPI
jgi:hypothetical protein